MLVEQNQSGSLDCLGQMWTWVCVFDNVPVGVVVSEWPFQYRCQVALLDYKAPKALLDYNSPKANLDYKAKGGS